MAGGREVMKGKGERKVGRMQTSKLEGTERPFSYFRFL